MEQISPTRKAEKNKISSEVETNKSMKMKAKIKKSPKVMPGNEIDFFI